MSDGDSGDEIYESKGTDGVAGDEVTKAEEAAEKVADETAAKAEKAPWYKRTGEWLQKPFTKEYEHGNFRKAGAMAGRAAAVLIPVYALGRMTGIIGGSKQDQTDPYIPAEQPIPTNGYGGGYEEPMPAPAAYAEQAYAANSNVPGTSVNSAALEANAIAPEMAAEAAR